MKRNLAINRSTVSIAISACLVVIAGCSLLVPQTRYITQTFFPDLDVEIQTPAFEKEEGFTTYEELMVFLKKTLAGKESIAKMTTIGRSQLGRDIPMVEIKASETPLVKVWLQGGMHGNEPASSEGLLLLLKKILHDPSFTELLSKAHIAIVPTVNVDGSEIQSRYADNGLDLNRDQTKLMIPESLALKNAFNAFAPQVAVDFHEYRPYRRDFVHFGENGITSSYDVMFLYSGNLNVPESLRQFTKDVFVENAKSEVRQRGLRARDYITTRKVHGDIHFNQGSTNARASATSFALANTVASLIEVRGVGIGRESYKRRVMTTFWVAQSYLQTAVKEYLSVHETLSQSAMGASPVTVKSRREQSRQSIEAIDLIQSKTISIEVMIHDALRSEATLIRQRPTSYLLLPSQAKLAEKLKILGLEVSELEGAQRLSVEGYQVTQYSRAPLVYEGMLQQKVDANLVKKSMDFPVGTFVVKLDQPRANLAVEVLEPEATNSFVSFGVLETEQGQELPVYRCMEELGAN